MKRSPLDRATRRCTYCGQPFRPPYETQRYCSRDCWTLDSRRGEVRTCETCAKTFYVRPSKRGARFCSNACKGFQAAKLRLCIICGEEFRVAPRGYARSTCSTKCWRESVSRGKRGVRNPAWTEGRTRNIARWQSQAETHCHRCGSDRRLRLHHVIYAQHIRRAGGDLFDPDNSLTLCWDCHNLHHHSVDGRLSLRDFRPENIAYANRLLGAAAAAYYWIRYYEVEDPAALIATLSGSPIAVAAVVERMRNGDEDEEESPIATPPMDVCRRGHPMTGDNLGLLKNGKRAGSRYCKTCKNERRRKALAR